MSDQTDRARRSAAARRFAERFRWRAIGTALTKVYGTIGGHVLAEAR
jgi:hypothetical protein